MGGREILPGLRKPQADGEPLPEEVPRLMEEARPIEKPSREFTLPALLSQGEQVAEGGM